MTFAIETNSLTKQYAGHAAVDNLNLNVPTGSIYGFLGPNGAGKSTTMKMILRLVHPTAGSVRLLGEEMNDKNRLALLKNTGSLIESPSCYGHLTGRENLQIAAMLKGVPTSEIDEVLQIVRMEKQQNKKVSHYSLGMKQRLGLACALLGKPKVLLLDEPTNGLDPAGIQEMRELIRSLPARYGMTVLVSSHLLPEIDQLASYVGIINRGSLIFQGELEELRAHSRRHLLLGTLDNERAHALLRSRCVPCRPESGLLQLPDMPPEQIAGHIAALVKADIGICRIEERQKSLEEIFLSLTGKQVSL